eukprot:TRINITY_DN1963_c0_g1_i1.p3 TRINITY_DN1963_c0_g1~~TRINITY_DN1963_c0_g1_i1.p3  ORF type:complete len:302 (-),score=110.98 TRINITY_DN1963_c0_g1_i1:156-1061(-)
MSLNGTTDVERLDDLSSYTYKDQAIWALNAFWNTFGEAEAENFWAYKHMYDELDHDKKDQGNQLDEMMAHRFLEKFDKTLSVRNLREKLKAVGIEKVRFVPLVNFLIVHYNIDWHILVNATQGDNQEQIAEAQRMLNAVTAAFEEAQAREADAKVAVAASKAALAELKIAKEELEAQEKAYNDKTTSLTAKSESGGAVTKNKAKAELAIHLAEDPLPLRRAKITVEAAVKKAERAEKAAEVAKEAASAALNDAADKVKEAEDYLRTVKAQSGSAQGTIWWMERQLTEAKKYLPLNKGGIAR